MVEVKLYNGDCLEVMKTLPDNSVDSIVTDPPYGLNFMGKKWDYDVPSIEIWEECLRVLKPGGHLLAFSGTRTYHRMVVRIEDAGFEIRDMVSWIYGSGFPKSLNIGKAIDKLQGNEREIIGSRIADDIRGGNFKNQESKTHEINITQGNSKFEGWGTALKPSNEPIVMARKPLSEKTIAENVLKWGVGGINIDDCRISYNKDDRILKGGSYGGNRVGSSGESIFGTQGKGLSYDKQLPKGRFPANLILSYPEDEYDENGNLLPNPEKDEVEAVFPNVHGAGHFKNSQRDISGKGKGLFPLHGKGGHRFGDEGSASRFFYCAKTSKKDKDEGLESFQNKQSSNLPMRSKDGNKEGLGLDGTTIDRVTEGKNVHPTVKPTSLMQYLTRLVTPKGGIVLDPFMGSGTTGKACKLEGFGFIGIEREEEYFKIAKARIDFVKVERKLF